MKAKPKKIVMCGCHETGVNLASYLFENNFKIDYFVSLTPLQAKKYKVSGYHSFEKIAEQFNVPIYYPKDFSLKHKKDVEFFREHEFDLLLNGGWQRIIPKEVLDSLRIGGIGVHGSPEYLPKGRGRSPLNWAIIKGKQKLIVHIFLMTPNVDDGDIIDYDICDINEWDTIRTLYYKNSVLTKRMILKNMNKILQNKFKAKPQTGTPTYFPKRTLADGLIDWNKDVKEIYDFIRALTNPYPGAFTFLDKKITIWDAQPFDSKIKYLNARPGEIVEKFISNEFVVKCKKGSLLVTRYEGNVKKGQIFSAIEN